MSAPTEWPSADGTETALLPVEGDGAALPGGFGYRVPRVDLLPVEVRDARRLKAVQRSLAIGLAGVAVLVAGVYVTSLGYRARSAQGLEAEQHRTVTLTAEQQHYAQVPRTQAEVTKAEAALAQGMTDDVRWDKYLDRLSRTTPVGVSLTHLTATIGNSAGAAGTATDGTGATGTDPLEPSGVGMLTVKVAGHTQLDTAAWLDALDAIPGLAGASFSSSAIDSPTSGSGSPASGTTVASSSVITTDALSHHYDAGKG